MPIARRSNKLLQTGRLSLRFRLDRFCPSYTLPVLIKGIHHPGEFVGRESITEEGMSPQYVFAESRRGAGVWGPVVITLSAPLRDLAVTGTTQLVRARLRSLMCETAKVERPVKTGNR